LKRVASTPARDEILMFPRHQRRGPIEAVRKQAKEYGTCQVSASSKTRPH